MLKRVISLILSLVMVFSVMPVSAWAADENPADQDEDWHDHGTEEILETTEVTESVTESIPETTEVTEPVMESTPETMETEAETVPETTGEAVETITEVHIAFADPVPGEIIPSEAALTVTTVPEEAQGRVALKGQWYVSYGDDSTYALAPEGTFQPGANYALALTVEAAEGTTEETVWMVNDSIWQDMNISVRDESGAVQNVGVCRVYMLPRSQQTYLADSATYWDGTTATAFAGGSGTSSNPYLIATCGQLNFLATLLKSETSSNYTTYGKAYYKLTANLNMSSRNFTGIPYFGGVFDGAGYTISGLYISGGDDLGLFGTCTGATIKNLTVKGGVYGSRYVGGIVGSAVGTNITNCKNYCKVSGRAFLGGIAGSISRGSTKPAIKNCINYGVVDGTSSCIGGIVGQIYDNHSSQVSSVCVTVSYCGNTAAVYGYDQVGGIVGYANGGGINYCGNAGNVTATAYSSGTYDEVCVAGIVGELEAEATDWENPDIANNYSYGYIKNSYNTGTITGEVGVSGVGGEIWGGSLSPEVTNLYNTGKIQYTYGQYNKYYEVTSYSLGKNMFYLQNVNPGSNKGTAAVMSDSQMQSASNFNGFTFSSTAWGWDSTGTYKYPIIASLGVLTPVACSHSYTGYVSNNDATCTEYGTKTTKCKYNCGSESTIKDTSIAPGHIWDEGKITKNPNVLDVGVMTYTCTRCSETKTEDLPAGVVAEGITCTLEDGVLIISGEGPMPDYSYTITSTSANQPWAPYADQITKVIVEDGITAIGASSFDGMSNLKTAELADSVATIGTYAFSSCGTLSKVNIPTGVKKIEGYSFLGCESLTSLRIHAGVTLLKPTAFIGCKNLMIIWVDAGNTVYASNEEGVVFSKDMKTLVFLPSGRSGTYTVPSGVTTIGSYAFSACNGINKVILPDTLTTVAEYAFADCSGLKEVKLPQGVTSIGNSAFSDCSALEEIDIPGGVKSIGEYTFLRNYALTSVVLPEGLTTIGANAFYSCKKLKEITLPESLTTINEYAFADCDALTEIVIPSGVKTIPKYAFYLCDVLKRVNILGSGVALVNYAFANASGLEEVWMYGTRGTISSYAFSGKTVTVWYPAGDGTWTGYTGNNYGGTLTWKKHCTGEHKQVINAAIPPTCLDSGLTEGISCSVCDVVAKVQEVVPSLGHTEIAVAEKPATCTQFGISAGTKCSVCGQVLSGLEVILSSGHAEVIDEAVEATCTSDGKTEGKHCSACGEVLVAQEVIPGGHTVENGICTKCEKYGTCGENLTWNLDGNGVLTISGTGDMVKYNTVFDTPWSAYSLEIKKLKVDEGVTSISANAFNGCENLSNITLPNSISYIGSAAFIDCISLRDVTLPTSLTHISAATFMRCTSLTSIILPENIVTVGDMAFSKCTSLTDITFTGNAPEFMGDTSENGSGVFENVTAKAYYPAGNETWTEDVMQDYGGNITWVAVCTNGHTEVIDEAVEATCTSDGKTEGKHCSACGEVLVKQEVIPGGHTVEDGICTRCEKYGACGDNLTWTLSEDGVLTISGEGEMYDYKWVDLPWYKYYDQIDNIIIGEGVTHIGEYAFTKCSNMTSVMIPESVISIGAAAFKGCSSITSITIPSSVTSIGDAAFLYCNNLETIVVDNANTAYYSDENGILFDNEKRTLICWPEGKTGAYTIPDSVTSIGDGAFSNCNNLTSVTISNSVTHIGSDAFGNCDSLTAVIIPNSVTYIGLGAFADCDNLKEVTIGDSVATIGDYAFTACDRLMSVTIPRSVTSIGRIVFAECSSLMEITFKGDAPISAGGIFNYVTATAYYPLDNETWTEDVMQDYGGDITWVGYLENVASVNGVNYGSLEKALENAKPGDVVKLCKDIAADTVIVHEGITLDLNGYTLEADYIFAVNGSAIVDRSEENTGLLKTDANHVMISKNNEQLPIWNGEGYVFTTVHFLKALLYHDNNKVQYAFLPQFKKVATDLMKDGFEGNMVTVEVRVSWETIQGREYRNLVFNNDQVALAISSGGAFILTFSGFSQLNLTTDVAIEAVVYSETGVSKVSDAIYVDVTPDEA